MAAGDTMLVKILFLCATSIACFAPHFFSVSKAHNKPSTFPGWPKTYEGQALISLPLSEKERYFQKDFPGKIARFHDGHKEIVVRWVEESTRKLHPARDCFKGVGYTIEPLDLMVSKQGIRMSCFLATKDSTALKVCEYIQSTSGESWSDVSEWYWSVVFGNSPQGWMSYVIANKSM